jgi:CBS domain-containing protein
MKVGDVMARGVDLVDPSATVQVAATQMAELDVGAILIGNAERIEGILTDRDIIVRVVVEGSSPANVQARDVMTPDVVTCRAEDTIEAAFSAMRQGQFRRMPVLDEAGKPVGVVALSDLAKHIEGPEKLAATLRDISDPHRSRKVENQPSPEGGSEGESADAKAAGEPGAAARPSAA